MKMNNKIKLSPSALNKFIRCPRCFWLEKNRDIRAPRGVFPSLPSGMDIIIKEYFDRCRKHGVVPSVIKSLPFELSLVSKEKIDNWRDYKITELKYENKKHNAILSGALDDCARCGNRYIPIDYKTKGFALKKGDEKFYQVQLDCYSLILTASGYDTVGKAYLLYYIPKAVDYNNHIEFNVIPVEIKTSIDNARKVFEAATACLRSKIPKASSNCGYCKYYKNRGIINRIIKWTRRNIWI